jgi:hypothetical protein
MDHGTRVRVNPRKNRVASQRGFHSQKHHRKSQLIVVGANQIEKVPLQFPEIP